AFCGDDAYDMDEGYRGKGQFWLALNGPESDHAAEHNGGDNPVQGLPHSDPQICNATYAGYFAHNDFNLISFSEDGTGHYYNSLFLNPGKGIKIQYINGMDDSYRYFTDGEISFTGNIIYPGQILPELLYAEAADQTDLTNENKLLSEYFYNNNTSENPGIIADSTFDLLPPSSIFSNLVTLPDPWFEEVSYKGAFGSNNWLAGWTLLYETGLVSAE
ncbi:MAG: hypothetical protein ACOYXB_03940, partial [Bacteroidota bacterium]